MRKGFQNISIFFSELGFFLLLAQAELEPMTPLMTASQGLALTHYK